MSPLNLEKIREQFPALQRQQNGEPVVYLDGPAGTQVPLSVADAVRSYLLDTNANHGASFATSRESDQMIDTARQACSDFVGASNPDEIFFGQNMTSLTFALSRSLAKTWEPGDEIVVTRLDHDANIAPWVSAAEESGVTVRYVDFLRHDFTLDLDDFARQLSPKTKLVAIGAASNATGGRNPIETISQMAHQQGALVFVDAVHYGPHALIDVKAWDCDFVACSAYKFFGPHIGFLWGRESLLKALHPYKVRPSSNSIPDRWMTGTQNHEGIAGLLAAIDYLANLVQKSDSRRSGLRATFQAIQEYEQKLSRQLLEGFQEIDGMEVYGITDFDRLEERFATFSITHPAMKTSRLAAELGDRGIFVWHGNYYALEFTECLDLEPEGMIRLGFVHYNTPAEIDRVLHTLKELLLSVKA